MNILGVISNLILKISQLGLMEHTDDYKYFVSEESLLTFGKSALQLNDRMAGILSSLIPIVNLFGLVVFIAAIAGGTIYVTILGINIARAADADTRGAAKKRMVNTIIGAVALVAIGVLLQWGTPMIVDYVAMNDIQGAKVGEGSSKVFERRIVGATYGDAKSYDPDTITAIDAKYELDPSTNTQYKNGFFLELKDGRYVCKSWFPLNGKWYYVTWEQNKDVDNKVRAQLNWAIIDGNGSVVGTAQKSGDKYNVYLSKQDMGYEVEYVNQKKTDKTDDTYAPQPYLTGTITNGSFAFSKNITDIKLSVRQNASNVAKNYITALKNDISSIKSDLTKIKENLDKIYTDSNDLKNQMQVSLNNINLLFTDDTSGIDKLRNEVQYQKSLAVTHANSSNSSGAQTAATAASNAYNNLKMKAGQVKMEADSITEKYEEILSKKAYALTEITKIYQRQAELNSKVTLAYSEPTLSSDDRASIKAAYDDSYKIINSILVNSAYINSLNNIISNAKTSIKDESDDKNFVAQSYIKEPAGVTYSESTKNQFNIYYQYVKEAEAAANKKKPNN